MFTPCKIQIAPITTRTTPRMLSTHFMPHLD
jgi:hypothetical protein